MKWHSLSGSDLIRAIGVGVAVSILTAAFMAANMSLAMEDTDKIKILVEVVADEVAAPARQPVGSAA